MALTFATFIPSFNFWIKVSWAECTAATFNQVVSGHSFQMQPRHSHSLRILLLDQGTANLFVGTYWR